MLGKSEKNEFVTSSKMYAGNFSSLISIYGIEKFVRIHMNRQVHKTQSFANIMPHLDCFPSKLRYLACFVHIVTGILQMALIQNITQMIANSIR